MNTGANLANFGEEFGPHASLPSKGSDNSEEPANKARHSNWTFKRSSDSSMGSASDGTKDSISQDIKGDGSKGISMTKDYGTDNFN